MFNAANARDMAAKSAKVRRERKEAMAKLVLLPAPAPALPAPVLDAFNMGRLVRLREGIVRLEQKLATAQTAQDADRWSAALMRASEQERQLSGRSLPPVIKASEQKARPGRREIQPL